MNKGTRTAAELKHLVQIRMNALEEIQDDGEQIFARDVEWQQPDESGCNWNMDGYRGPATYATDVRALIDRVRREYRLREDPRDFT